MTFRKDELRTLKGQGPQIFNVMRKIAMRLLKQKNSMKAKKTAGLNYEYSSTLLESGSKTHSLSQRYIAIKLMPI